MAVKMLGYALTDKMENDSEYATRASFQFVRAYRDCKRTEPHTPEW